VNNGKKLIIGLLLGLLILVLEASDYSSSNTDLRSSGTPQSDIAPLNAMISGGSFIEGDLYNGALYDYKNVQIEVSALDKYGNVVSSKKTMIKIIKADDDAYFSVYFPYNSNIVSCEVKILNATAT
jgi:hypothetical protein